MIDEKLIQAVISKKHSAFTIFYNEIVDHFFSYLKSNFSKAYSTALSICKRPKPNKFL